MGPEHVLVLDGNGKSLTGTYGLAPDQVFATESVGRRVRPAGDGVNWFLTDNQGTVRDVVQFDSTTDTTTEVDHLVYSAFGQLVSTDPSGRRRFADFLLQRRLARPADRPLRHGPAWYDAVDAVFASYDPLGFRRRADNLSEFCRQRPDEFGGPKRRTVVAMVLGSGRGIPTLLTRSTTPQWTGPASPTRRTRGDCGFSRPESLAPGAMLDRLRWPLP